MNRSKTIFRSMLMLTGFLAVLSSLGQGSYRVEFVIPALPGQKMMLYSYYGDQKIKIDSTVSNDYGVFNFSFTDQNDPGIYHIVAGKSEGLDFIFNKENSVVKIDSKFTPDSAVVYESLENKTLFDYLSKKIYYELRLELLGPLVYYYPKDDPFYGSIDKQFNKQQEEYDQYLEEVYKKYPDLIVTRFIKFDQLEDVRPGELSPQRIQYLKQHYFDGIDLADTLLLYSPLLPGRIIDYLSLYVSPGVGKEQQETLFKQAVDSLMDFTLPGNKVREVVVNYLIEGFQAYGLEDVMSYMVENYVLNQSCVSEQKEETLRKRIEGFKKMAVGNIAPDFEVNDIKGNTIKLSTFPASYKILFFWSSECPHCADAIPGVSALLERYPGKAEIIAISVDTDEAAWKKAVSEKTSDWVNIAELKGWDGKIANEYYIYATPTFVVLDENLRVVSKPNGVKDLQEFLSGL